MSLLQTVEFTREIRVVDFPVARYEHVECFFHSRIGHRDNEITSAFFMDFYSACWRSLPAFGQFSKTEARVLLGQSRGCLFGELKRRRFGNRPMGVISACESLLKAGQ